MEKDVLTYLRMETRTEAVAFLKALWREESVPCPRCEAASLEHLHKKAKKSSSEWQCPACGEVYRLIRILDELNEQ